MFERPVLIRFQSVRNFTFDQVRTNEDGSKVKIRTVYQSRDHELFEISFLIHLLQFELDQSKILNSLKADQKLISEQLESHDH